MFTDYYGLSFNPFDKQCQKEKDCFLSNDFKQMSSRLSYVRDVRGIGVFTAQPGMGKSFCLRCFARSMNQNLGHMEYICLSTVGIREFYYLLCSALGLEPAGSKPQMFRACPPHWKKQYIGNHQKYSKRLRLNWMHDNHLLWRLSESSRIPVYFPPRHKYIRL